MTVYVSLHKLSQVDEWEYEYLAAYDMVVASRVECHLPVATLQGAYSLIAKVDAQKILSYFETVTVAEVTYWQVITSLVAPEAEAGQLSLVQDIDDGQSQGYFTDPTYSLFYTQLGEPVDPALLMHVAIGEHVIVDITHDGRVVGVWMLALPQAIGEKHASKQ